MTKEEILEKSQKENKGKDLFELETISWAVNWAFMASWIIIIAITVINLIRKGTLEFSALSVGSGMYFILFLLKFIKLHKKHELLVTLLYGLLFVACFVAYILLG